MNNLFQKYIMYITYTYTNFNLNNLKYFGFLAGFMLINQILTSLFLAMYYMNNIEIAFDSIEFIMKNVDYGWFIRYLHANGASFFFIILYLHIEKLYIYILKNIDYFLIYLSLILMPSNIFFCNEIERNNNSTQVIENTNINSLTVLGGILAVSICGFIIYKIYNWYNPSNNTPSSSSNLPIDSSNLPTDSSNLPINFEEVSTIIENNITYPNYCYENLRLDHFYSIDYSYTNSNGNSLEPIYDYISILDDIPEADVLAAEAAARSGTSLSLQSVEEDPNFSLNNIQQIDLVNFDFANFYLYLDTGYLKVYDFEFNIQLCMYENSMFIVRSYLDNITQLIYFINDHFMKHFNFHEFDSILEMQTLLTNLFSIHNAIKILALENCTSLEEQNELLRQFQFIEDNTSLMLSKMSTIINTGILY